MNNLLIDLNIRPCDQSEIASQVTESSSFKNLNTKTKKGLLPIELAPVLYRLKRENTSLFWFPLGDFNIIIRPLTRGEYHIYSQYIQQYEEDIDPWPLLEHCVLYPKKGDEGYDAVFGNKALAGWTNATITNILKVSLFDKPEEMQIIKETYEEGISGGEFNLSTEWLLRGNLPGLTKDKIDNMTALEIMESISAIKHLTSGNVDFNFIVSEKEMKKREAAAMDAALIAATPKPVFK